MRILKLAFLSIIIIFLILLGFSLLLPSHVRISRAIDINASVTEVTPFIADMSKWQQWNAILSDSAITVSTATRDQIKTNRFDIYREAVKADSVSTRWAQPNGKTFYGNFSCMPSEKVTVVQWYFDFHLRWYPWEKFGSIIYDDRMGPAMEKSLAQLKTLLETSP
jgi:Polyketide cyclase / dehydrase and lipid transport